jgi:hypothetical protein
LPVTLGAGTLLSRMRARDEERDNKVPPPYLRCHVPQEGDSAAAIDLPSPFRVMAGNGPTWPGMGPQLPSKSGKLRPIYIQRKATASHGKLKTFPTYSQSRATCCTRPYRSPGGSRSSARNSQAGSLGGKCAISGADRQSIRARFVCSFGPTGGCSGSRGLDVHPETVPPVSWPGLTGRVLTQPACRRLPQGCRRPLSRSPRTGPSSFC